MKKNILWMMEGFVMAAISWSCNGGKNATGAPANIMATESQTVKELPLPDVPPSITEPEERAAYAVRHFWDSLNPSDHTQSLDTALMEQTFANFISLLPYATEDARNEAVTAFTDRCSTDSDVYDLAAYISHHYLDDPNSPMRNEELYILFLRRFASDPKLTEAKRERAAYRLEQAMKNRPGTKTADFRLLTREGKASTLLRELKDTTLVIFYDYDCEHCKETVARLEDPAAGVKYPVVAVEATEDKDGWDATKAGMPKEWTICFATDPLDGESYYFPALPSLYLLAGDGTVIVKDGAF